MEREFLAFVIVDMDGNLRFRLAFRSLQVGGHKVISSPWRHTLGKFSRMVGHKLPLNFLLVGASDGYFHPINRAIIQPIDRAEEERIVIVNMRLRVATKWSAARKQQRKRQGSCRATAIANHSSSSSSSSSSSATLFSSSGLVVITSKSLPHSAQETTSPSSISSSSMSRSVSHSGHKTISVLR